MSKNHFPIRAVVLAVAVVVTPMANAAVTMPSSGKGSTLYYHLGGSDAAALAPNPAGLRLHLGLGGGGRFNYSCGKFDVQTSMQQTIDGLKNLDDVVMNAIKAAIAALPMYILQRAQPGLYELVQTYLQKARDLVNMSFESCEQMETQIRDGKNPYDKYVTMAMGEQWKEKASSGGDVVTAKQTVQTDSGSGGMTWIFGGKQGGKGQEPIRIVKDLVKGAYNLTMMQPTTASATAGYTGTGARLAKAFPTPQAASEFAVDAVGDLQIATCDQPTCPAKGTETGIGLSKKFEDEIPIAQTQLGTVLGASVPSASDLEAASAPGVLVTRDLVDAIRSLPKPEQAIAYSRLSQEIALARTVDRALLVRQMLMTGKTIPAASSDNVTEPVNVKLEEVNKAIDSLMYEARVRKELISSSAGTLLQTYQAARASSAALPATKPIDTRPLENGKVQ
jgi:integrating conjugative element protein (TIGR03755 family)